MSWVYYNKIPIYPIFYLLKGDYIPKGQYAGFLLKYYLKTIVVNLYWAQVDIKMQNVSGQEHSMPN